MCFAVGLLCRAQYMYLGNAVGNCYCIISSSKHRLECGERGMDQSLDSDLAKSG